MMSPRRMHRLKLGVETSMAAPIPDTVFWSGLVQYDQVLS